MKAEERFLKNTWEMLLRHCLRRGRMEGMEARNGNQIIRGFIPLSEILVMQTDLRSKTQGRGTHSMEPSHYEEVPKSVLEQIVALRSKKAE